MNAPKLKKMTNKEKLFCEEYMVNGHNQKAAAIKAGYLKSYAPAAAARILKKHVVRMYIGTRMKSIENEERITKDWKMRKLKQIVDHAIPHAEDGKTIVKEPRNAIAAIAELNKMQGDYAAIKHEIQADINYTEIRARIEELKKDY